MTVYPHELMAKGGEWLGAVRSWIQVRVWNGEHVTWGNQTEPIELKRPVVAELEEFGAIIAAAAMNEQMKRLAPTIKKLIYYTSPEINRGPNDVNWVWLMRRLKDMGFEVDETRIKE